MVYVGKNYINEGDTVPALGDLLKLHLEQAYKRLKAITKHDANEGDPDSSVSAKCDLDPIFLNGNWADVWVYLVSWKKITLYLKVCSDVVALLSTKIPQHKLDLEVVGVEGQCIFKNIKQKFIQSKVY